MSIRPTTNGSRSAGQRQQPESESRPDQLLSNPAQSQPQSSYYIIGEQRYGWERALGSQRGARGGAPQMYSHDPRIALFGASSSNNNQPNNLNNPLQSQFHNHSHSHSHYYPARIVAGSNNFNLRSRNARNILGQQQPHTTRNHQQNVPLNVRCSPRATAGTTKPQHSEHSMRGTTNGAGVLNATGSTQLRDIGRPYPLWLPEYKRRAFNVSPLERNNKFLPICNVN